ncbi:hypothetical protein P885DRAFT_63191 [Corynascus similis CBS 632.67]
MVSLRSLIAGVALLAIVNGLKSITQKSQALQATARNISTVDGDALNVGKDLFPILFEGYENITWIANALSVERSEMEPIQKRAVPSRITRRGPDADLVFSTFQEIVRAHETLCSILIEKADLFRSTGAGGVLDLDMRNR